MTNPENTAAQDTELEETAAQAVNARGTTLVADAFCLPYLCAIGAMPLPDFRKITGRATCRRQVVGFFCRNRRSDRGRGAGPGICGCGPCFARDNHTPAFELLSRPCTTRKNIIRWSKGSWN